MSQPETFRDAVLSFELSPFAYDEAQGEWLRATQPPGALLRLNLEGENGVLRLEYLIGRAALAGLFRGASGSATLDPDGLHGLHRPEGYRPMEFRTATIEVVPVGKRHFTLRGTGEAEAPDGSLWRYAIDQTTELEEVVSEGSDQPEAEAALEAVWPEWRGSGAKPRWLALDDPSREQMTVRWPEPYDLDTPSPLDEEEEAPALVPVDASGWESPSDARPLVLEGRALSVQTATFEVRIQTEHWSHEAQAWVYGDPVLELGITLDVDEHSGEDGAAAPEARFSMPTFAGSWRALFRSTFREPEVPFEAWYGNDAPSLDQNVVAIEGLEGSHVRLRWQARYADGNRLYPFLFAGPCELGGLQLQVKRAEDATAILDQIFPDGSWREWGPPASQPYDMGDWAPAERRHWVSLHYTLPD